MSLDVGFEMVESVRAADWLKERAVNVPPLGDLRSGGAVIPKGFEAYARLFHPAERKAPGENREPLRWATIAEWNGKAVHPQMGYTDIANLIEPHDPVPWGSHPDRMLGKEESRSLNAVLTKYTTTPERCYFLLWRGYGGLLEGRRWKKGTIHLPDRKGQAYVLFSGPLESLLAFYGHVDGQHWGQAPNYWWPEDQSWFAASDIDSFDTLVGGSQSCIEAVLDNTDLEALTIGLTDKEEMQAHFPA